MTWACWGWDSERQVEVRLALGLHEPRTREVLVCVLLGLQQPKVDNPKP